MQVRLETQRLEIQSLPDGSLIITNSVSRASIIVQSVGMSLNIKPNSNEAFTKMSQTPPEVRVLPGGAFAPSQWDKPEFG